MNSWNAIGVVGAGTMGRGIAQVAAQSGANVWLCDTSADALDASQASLAKVMDRLVEKGRMSPEDARGVRERIRTTTSLEALKDCDMVVEAIVEDLDVKSTLFKQLEGIVAKSCVLATNTSSLSVTALARACQHPDRVLGLHFFNPAPLMALVEVVPALQTDPELPAFAAEQMRAWNKAPALAQDTPGFIVNRVARPFYSEALRILEEGVASAQDIDASMRAEGFRMGPFELMDLIGHDVNHAVTSTVHAAFFGDSRYRPSHTQRQLVAASWLGRKSGRGFYVYAEDGTRSGTDGTPSKEVSRRILAMLMNEAADAVFWRVASATDVDTAMQKGVNYPKGLLAWAEECGLPSVVETLDGLRARYGEERYRCSPLLRDLARAGGSFFAR